MYFGFIEISVCKEISEFLTLHVPLIEKTINWWSKCEFLGTFSNPLSHKHLEIQQKNAILSSGKSIVFRHQKLCFRSTKTVFSTNKYSVFGMQVESN